MNKIHITEDCIIYNDMPLGWISGKSQPKWHHSLYTRWRDMWRRCRNTKSKDYNNYQDCEIDERYRYLSNYINDIMTLENFDKLCEEPSKWHIDKDKIDPNNRFYAYEHLSIITFSSNIQERDIRNNLRRPIIGINIKDGSMLSFCFVRQVKIMNFLPNGVVSCLKGRRKSYKGYKWYYLNIIEL